MESKLQGCLIITAISIILSVFLTTCFNASRYIDINKTFNPRFKATKNGITFGCNIINLVQEIEYYKNTSVDVRLSSNPYWLYFYIKSDKIKNVKVKELSFECDGTEYICKKYCLSERVKNNRFNFRVNKIALPYINNKILTINFKLQLTSKDGKVIEKDFKAKFKPTFKTESNFKFIELIMSC